MLSADGALLVVVYAQPPVLGAALFVLGKRRLASAAALGALGLGRQRRPGVRAFECAVAARLGVGGLGPQGGSEGACWAFLALFLIYDLDFLFFLSEVVCFHHWAGAQAALAFLYGALFVAGAWVDNNVYSPTWALLP
jgi:hypothetical protein